jgi:hypothetical protein
MEAAGAAGAWNLQREVRGLGRVGGITGGSSSGASPVQPLPRARHCRMTQVIFATVSRRSGQVARGASTHGRRRSLIAMSSRRDAGRRRRRQVPSPRGEDAAILAGLLGPAPPSRTGRPQPAAIHQVGEHFCSALAPPLRDRRGQASRSQRKPARIRQWAGQMLPG